MGGAAEAARPDQGAGDGSTAGIGRPDRDPGREVCSSGTPSGGSDGPSRATGGTGRRAGGRTIVAGEPGRPARFGHTATTVSACPPGRAGR